MANGRSDPIGKLKLEARYLPEPVKAWVTELVDGAWSHVLVNARSHLSSEYALIVKPYYQRSIDGPGYPFQVKLQLKQSGSYTVIGYGSGFTATH